MVSPFRITVVSSVSYRSSGFLTTDLTPGSIFSAGLILPLDIAVGIVVSLTMYGIYRMFRKGSLT